MRLHALSFTALLLLCGFGSCSSHLSDVCQTGLPSFEESFAKAELQLKEQGSRPARAIADLQSSKSRGAFTQEESEEWMSWAEAGLKQTQHYMDVAENEELRSAKAIEIRKILGQLANEWVSFHGYGHAGRIPEMNTTLARIREHASAARAIACETPAASPAVTRR